MDIEYNVRMGSISESDRLELFPADAKRHLIGQDSKVSVFGLFQTPHSMIQHLLERSYNSSLYHLFPLAFLFTGIVFLATNGNLPSAIDFLFYPAFWTIACALRYCVTSPPRLASIHLPPRRSPQKRNAQSSGACLRVLTS